jgi:hypothetical protein
VEAEELLDDQGVLVGGPLGVGGHPPVVQEVGLGQPALHVVPVLGLQVVEPDDGLGVPHVHGQQHHGP